MDITVIISCKDREQNLRYSLASIAGCSPHPTKILLVDFGSQPPLVVPDYNNLVEVIRVDKATNLFHKARALNIGLKRVQTKYVCMTDADVLFQSNFFDVVKTKLEKRNTLVMCKSDHVLQLPAWITVENVVEKYCELLTFARTTWKIKVGEGCCQALLTDQLKNVGGYDEKYIGWGYEDTDLIRRLTVLNYPTEYIHDVTSQIHLPHSRGGEYYANVHSSNNKKMLQTKDYKNNVIANIGVNWGEP
jgi:predicted glycosyltransferase involved in capsule biosynthesis